MSQLFATSEATVPQRYLTFEQIGEMSNEGIWVLDENALATYVNARAAEIFGYAPSEVIGRPASDFLFPEDHGIYAERLAALMRARSERLEACFRHRDGREVWCLVSAWTIHADDGRLAGFFSNGHDID
jgi:PAS domain S-box-containing protein